MKNTNFTEDFKKFINKGNILDLAVGIIIGTTFTAVVNSLANDIILPLISRAINFDISSAKIVLKEPVYDTDGETILKAAITFNYGNFIQTLLNFLIIALAIYFAVKVVKMIKNSYIKSQIKYVKQLKIKHPEWFDEEDEFGTILYERLKREHPEYFKNEIVEKIEKQIPKEDPQEIANRILVEINENLKALNKDNNKNEIEK